MLQGSLLWEILVLRSSIKKRNEGRHHFVALTHVARKLIRVIFKWLKTNTQFVSQV